MVEVNKHNAKAIKTPRSGCTEVQHAKNRYKFFIIIAIKNLIFY